MIFSNFAHLFKKNIRMKLKLFIIAAAAAATLASCGSTSQVTHYTLKVEKTLPHDATAYTQGLFFENDQLFESTGQYGSSSLRKVALDTGEVTKRLDFEDKYFAEGSCILNGNLYMLTWLEGVCFVFDPETFETIKSFEHRRQGWGLTTDGKNLIMSDGSAQLYFKNPDTFVDERSVTVRLNGKSVNYLNELEYIDGKVWANVYYKSDILIIDPATGNVEGVIDCSALEGMLDSKDGIDVLNGIAYRPSTKEIFLTGKYWPNMFSISLQAK